MANATADRSAPNRDKQTATGPDPTPQRTPTSRHSTTRQLDVLNESVTSPKPSPSPRQTTPNLEYLRKDAERLEKENRSLRSTLQHERDQADKQNTPRDMQLEGLKEF